MMTTDRLPWADSGKGLVISRATKSSGHRCRNQLKVLLVTVDGTFLGSSFSVLHSLVDVIHKMMPVILPANCVLHPSFAEESG